MRPMNLMIASTLLLAAGAGCDDGRGTGGAAATEADISSYQELARQVQTAAADYSASMMGPEMTTVSACRGIHEGYDDQVRLWISQMMQMSASMDDFMNGHGGAAVADHRCVSATMMDELDSHHALACTSPDLQEDRAEASRHAGRMRAAAGQSSDRCDQMRRVLDGGAADWKPMMAGCQGWDGGCGDMMHDRCCEREMGGGCREDR